MKSDSLTVGPLVEKLEREISNFTGYKEAVVVSSGTAALHCAYAAIGVSGTQVITSPLTFVSTASTAVLQGAKIVFCDVDEITGNIDPTIVPSLITDKTSVITTVDYAGNPCDEESLKNLRIKYKDITIISDAAHSFGSTLNNKAPGSHADLITYSFYPTKNITTAEGGAIVSNNSTLLEKARKFKMHGLVRDKENQRNPDTGAWHQEVHQFGLNYRLSDVHCALGLSQLARISAFKKKRRTIFDYYHTHLADIPEIVLPTPTFNSEPMWHLFPIRVPRQIRKNLFEELRSKGIIVQVNYLPVYWHPVFQDLGYKKGTCPVAEDYYEREISLPMHTRLNRRDLNRVVKIIRHFFGR